METMDTFASHQERENSYLKKADRLKYEDLDWLQSKPSADTDLQFLLTYFADVEGQVFFYARDLMNTSSAQLQEVRNFLTIWSYQEYFHSLALRRYLDLCQENNPQDRDHALRMNITSSEKATDITGKLFSKLASTQYLALYLTWGSINEAMTMRGYHQIAQTTNCPLLSELCKRIAKQESFHFGWYYTKAKEQLARSATTQKIVRYLLSKAWTPVGVGVKTRDEFKTLISILYRSQDEREEIVRAIDQTIHQMPGLSGLNLFASYLSAL